MSFVQSLYDRLPIFFIFTSKSVWNVYVLTTTTSDIDRCQFLERFLFIEKNIFILHICKIIDLLLSRECNNSLFHLTILHLFLKNVIVSFIKPCVSRKQLLTEEKVQRPVFRKMYFYTTLFNVYPLPLE